MKLFRIRLIKIACPVYYLYFRFLSRHALNNIRQNIILFIPEYRRDKKFVSINSRKICSKNIFITVRYSYFRPFIELFKLARLKEKTFHLNCKKLDFLNYNETSRLIYDYFGKARKEKSVSSYASSLKGYLMERGKYVIRQLPWAKCFFLLCESYNHYNKLNWSHLKCLNDIVSLCNSMFVPKGYQSL